MNLSDLAMGLSQGLDTITSGHENEAALGKAAGLFHSLGTPEASQFADLLSTDPASAALLAQQMGGVTSLYTLMSKAAVTAAAARARGVEGAALDAVGSGQPVPQGAYSAVAAVGGRPSDLAASVDAARKGAQPPEPVLPMRDRVVKALGLNQRDWTTDSMDKALDDFASNGYQSFDRGLLVPSPARSRSGTAPHPGTITGYNTVRDPTDPSGYRYVPVPGAPGKMPNSNQKKTAAAAVIHDHPEYMDEANDAFKSPEAFAARQAYFEAFNIFGRLKQGATLQTYRGRTVTPAPPAPSQ